MHLTEMPVGKSWRAEGCAVVTRRGPEEDQGVMVMGLTRMPSRTRSPG
jgi:hypothetical protein